MKGFGRIKGQIIQSLTTKLGKRVIHSAWKMLREICLKAENGGNGF